MRTIAILGGSVVGAAAALQLARSGWQVTVLDAELALLREPGTTVTPRAGAPHAVQAHGFPSRACHELVTRLPDVHAALLAAGAEDLPFAANCPPPLYDGGRAGDDAIRTFRTRRVTLDRVLARAIAAEPGVRLRAERVVGIELEDGIPPRATGWRLATGEVVSADVLIDAGGRRSPVTGWLVAAGLAPQEDVAECGLSYYGRHYAITGPRPPLNSGFADVHEFPTYLQLGFLGDNDTLQLALSPHADDAALKVLRSAAAFDALVAANAAFAEWRAVLEPTTDVFCLGSLRNRMRSLVRDGAPVVLGLHQVGDALAMTNPNRGRGVSMGLAALGRLHDLLAEHGSDHARVAVEYAAWQRRVLAVYYREATEADQRTGSRIRAHLVGDAAPANAPAVELPADHPISSQDLERVAGLDPDLFRTFVRALSLLDDDREIASADVVRRVRELLPQAPPIEHAPPPTDGLHDRQHVLAVLAPYA